MCFLCSADTSQPTRAWRGSKLQQVLRPPLNTSPPDLLYVLQGLVRISYQVLVVLPRQQALRIWRLHHVVANHLGGAWEQVATSKLSKAHTKRNYRVPNKL